MSRKKGKEDVELPPSLCQKTPKKPLFSIPDFMLPNKSKKQAQSATEDTQVLLDLSPPSSPPPSPRPSPPPPTTFSFLGLEFDMEHKERVDQFEKFLNAELPPEPPLKVSKDVFLSWLQTLRDRQDKLASESASIRALAK